MPRRSTVALWALLLSPLVAAGDPGAVDACDPGVTEPGLIASYRPGALLLRADRGERSPALAARWSPGDGLIDATRAARLEPVDRDEIVGLGTGPWEPVPVRARVQWDALVGDTLREFAPTADGEATLVVLQGDEFAFFVSADGVLRIYPHESKPADRRVHRVVDEAEFAARAAARVRERYPACMQLLFAAGGDLDPSFVLFDAERRESVLVAGPAGAPNGVGNLLRTAARVPDTLIVRGQALGVLTRPVSSTARLAWLAAQTAATLPPPLPVSSGPVPPVEARAPMDPERWERRLDRLDLPPRSYARIEPLIDGDGAVGGLHFDGGIPPRIEVDDVIGGGQVQAHAARFEADEKEGNIRVVLELIHFGLAVFRLPVEIHVFDLARVQFPLRQFQRFDKLREDERFVVFGFQGFQRFEQHFKLGRFAFVFFIYQRGVNGDLAQSQQTFQHFEARVVHAFAFD